MYKLCLTHYYLPKYFDRSYDHHLGTFTRVLGIKQTARLSKWNHGTLHKIVEE